MSEEKLPCKQIFVAYNTTETDAENIIKIIVLCRVHRK